jgi:Ser/Thr protein kinase RdoA (MazF antagonist)
MSASTETMVGHGRTSIVYSHGEGRVVKVFPRGEALAEIEQEAAAAALVDELGVPSVHCYGLTEVDGQPGIVFERLTGPSLATIAERDIRRLPAMCRTLAQCHLQMHAAHTGQLPDVRELAAGLLTTPTLSTLRDSEKEWLRTYLRSLPAGDSVLHLDYHPQNVFQHQDGYAIIDWHSACRGAPRPTSRCPWSSCARSSCSPAPRRSSWSSTRCRAWSSSTSTARATWPPAP